LYELRILPSIRDVPREAWDGLVGPDSSPFVEWTWLDCMEQAGCVGKRTGWTPLHFTLYENDKLVAAAPAYAKENSEGEFVFDWSWADVSERVGVPYYPKLILAVPFTPATGDRALVAASATPEERTERTLVLAAAGKKWLEASGVSSAHVLFSTRDESERWAKAGYAARVGVQYHWHRRGDRTWEEFLARFNSKRRNALKREVAQPAKDGVTIETLSPGDLTPAIAKEMYALYRTTVDKFHWGRRYLTPRFFELVAEQWKDRLAWVVARKDGRILASAFNVQKGKVLYGRYWGAHVDMPFLHFNVCYYHGVKQCLEQGLDVFEPGAGGEHKKVRGFDPTLTYSNHWIEDRKLRGVIQEFLTREREAIEAYVARGAEEA
jgi:predicted N-acyltransferase